MFDEVRRMARALPGAQEGTSYGTPAFQVRRKMFARLREDGDTLVLRCNFHERAYLVESLPDVFHFTDHYRDYAYVLARLSAATPDVLRERLEDAYRAVAPKKLLAELDARAEN